MKFWLLFVLLLAGCATAPQISTAPLPVGCSSPAPAIRDIHTGRFYVDKNATVATPESLAKYKAETAPVRNWRMRVGALADKYVASGDKTDAQCAVQWIDEWARNKALLGDMQARDNGPQGYYEQKWALNAVAVAYLKVQAQATPEQDARISAWILKLSKEVRYYWTTVTPSATRNNHLYWVGSGIMAAGVVAHDKGSIDWARKAFDESMKSVAQDGSWPLEIDRSSKALHYEHFGLIPVLMMADLSRKVGEDWYVRGGEPLQRAINFVLDSQIDNTRIEQMARSKQEGVLTEDLFWIHMYAARNPTDPRSETILQGRSIKSTYFGEKTLPK